MMRATRSIVLSLLCVLLTGCTGGREELEDQYGRRTGDGARSINGTSAFSKMLQKAGHRVRSWRYLSPSLEDADVIVWFPSARQIDVLRKAKNPNSVASGNLVGEASLPSVEASDWISNWLRNGNGDRTLVFVGGDWTANVDYWTAAQPLAPNAQQQEYASELSKARAAQPKPSNKVPEPVVGEWLTIQSGNPKTVAKQLTGELFDGGNPFAEKKIDPARANLEHWSSLHPNLEAETLLADGQGHPIVSEIPIKDGWSSSDSRLILVENGGFLLNGALVNHERRKLAGRLIARLGRSEKRIVFLETGPAPTIRDTDPNPRPPTGLELFAVWPIGAVLAQIAALGIVYALARWPLFGVPRRLKDPSLTDFGRHVHALARLLTVTRDRSYAETQLRNYYQVTHREGEAPAEPPPTALQRQGSAGASPSR